MAFVKRWLNRGNEEDKDMEDGAKEGTAHREEEAPAGRRRWMPWRRKQSIGGGAGETDPFSDESTASSANAPLDLIMRLGQGEDKAIQMLQGDWLTAQKTQILIKDKSIAFQNESDKKKLLVTKDKISIQGFDCHVLLENSNSTALLWSDGDHWTRPNDQGSEVNRTAAWVKKSDAPASAVPSTLKVSCYEQAEIDGVYTLMEEQVRGHPVWAHKRQRLYTGPGGYWMFASAMKMSQDLGSVSSSTPHNGVNPDLISAWDYYSGEPGDKDGWVSCSMTSVSRCSDDMSTANTTPRRPISGVVRAPANSKPLTEEGMRLRILVFFQELGVEQPDGVVDDLVNRVLHGKGTIDRVLSALCKKFNIPEDRWLGRHCEAIMKYTLEQFYLTFDARHSDKAEELMEDIIDGRFSYDQVIMKLCERWKTKGARLADWTGDFPAALREGYGTKLQEDAEKDTGDKPTGEVTVTKTVAEPLLMEWKDHTLLDAVEPGGVGDRFKMHKFIGSRLTHINGKPISKWKELVSAVADKTEITFRFNMKQEGDTPKPVLRKLNAVHRNQPVSGCDSDDGMSVPSNVPCAPIQMAEAKHRNLVLEEEKEDVIVKLLPSKAGMSVGVVATHYKLWTAARKAMHAAADSAKPPADSAVKELKAMTDTLAAALTVAERAIKVTKMPDKIVNLINQTRGALTAAAEADAKAEQCDQRYLDAQTKCDATAELIEETKGRVADEMDESAQGDLKMLEEQMEEAERELDAAMAELQKYAAESPYYVWMIAAARAEEAALKKKREKREAKKARKASLNGADTNAAEDEPVVVGKDEEDAPNTPPVNAAENEPEERKDRKKKNKKNKKGKGGAEAESTPTPANEVDA